MSLLIRQTASVCRPLTKLYRKKQIKGLPVKCWKSHVYPLHLTTQSQYAGEPETHFLLLLWLQDPRIYSDVKVPTTAVTKISFHYMHIFFLFACKTKPAYALIPEQQRANTSAACVIGNISMESHIRSIACVNMCVGVCVCVCVFGCVCVWGVCVCVCVCERVFLLITFVHERILQKLV